ncbi:hypothetical protein PR048_008916 [Dryococelus australis]|uniref:Uncharacterized protein n=1 Tax=Dryococelus australis TaxID=614101 RepID=A0ABQ9HYU0_9NEOP|nr:hypothetical protein PR048_008916 [Dryococelus australis]
MSISKKKTVTSAAVEYSKQLEEDETTVLKCQSKFVVKHSKQIVDLLKILEGSSYPFAHKLHSKLSDLKTCFKLGKSVFKLSSLVGAEPAKLFLKNVGRLYDPRNIIAKGPEVDALDVEARVKTLPFLSSLSLHQMLEGYATRQAVINAGGGEVDVLAILLSLKNDFQEYSCCAVKCVNTGS